MTQLTFNAKIFNTIKVTPFYVNYEKRSNIFKDEQKHMLTKITMQRVKILKRVHDNIIKMKLKSTKYQNKKHKNAPQLKKRNKIFLLIKNLKT